VASVVVRAARPAEASAFLDHLEASSGVPPVDEDERRRLGGTPPVRDPDWWWGGHLVELDGVPVAYAGIRLPPRGVAPSDGCGARVDLAVERAHPRARPALRAALEDVRDHARRHGTAGPGGVEAWLRGATDEDLATAAEAGFTVHGRLHVLGATAATIAAAVPVAPPVPPHLRVRSFDPASAADGSAVVSLLTAAYPALGGWYSDGFARLRASPWFRADDLLLLESADAGPTEPLLGLHWMKRRGGGVGEVYNLAVSPSAQGRGLGALLLDLGLRHLADTGCDDVLLWVDAGNAPALALYRSRGFSPRWDDVSLAG